MLWKKGGVSGGGGGRGGAWEGCGREVYLPRRGQGLGWAGPAVYWWLVAC